LTQVNAGILGTGHSYPEMVLTNADLEKIVDTSDEWITSRTGIKQRHKAASGEYTSQFASRASQEAIERSGIDPNELELILCATVTPDQILPSTACLIQAQLGANKGGGDGYCRSVLGFFVWLVCGEFDDSRRPDQVRPGNWGRVVDPLRRLHRSIDLCSVRRWRRRCGFGSG
jgi:hypothetical protein